MRKRFVTEKAQPIARHPVRINMQRAALSIILIDELNNHCFCGGSFQFRTLTNPR
jgi:hypothetical protein